MPSDTLHFLHLTLLPLLAQASNFIMNDCKQMFHNLHLCNRQELLVYRWQTETCDRLQSQSELHTYRTCLGHSGIRIQEICNVCSFFTYPMICGHEKSKRLLRCLGDQFLIQGHADEIVVAARLCGNMVRSHDTSTTLMTVPFRPTVPGNYWTTLPTVGEEVNLPPFPARRLPLNEVNSLQPEADSNTKTKYFRSAEQNMTSEDKLTTNKTEITQRRYGAGEKPTGQKQEEVVHADDDRDDVSKEADDQEKSSASSRAPETMHKSVQDVADQLASPTERELPQGKDSYPKYDYSSGHPVPPPSIHGSSDDTRHYQRALYSQEDFTPNALNF